MSRQCEPLAAGERVVVIGGGQAAAQFVEALRFEGHRGPITLVAAERWLPYQRPPLSKEFLAGRREPGWLLYRPPDTYTNGSIETLLGRAAVGVDRAARTVVLADGTTLGYDRLAIATGTRARTLALPGAEHVHYLRTLDDALAIRARLAGAAPDGATRAVVIGGGFIGLETAAILGKLGVDVTVLETAPRLLPRAGGELLAGFLGAVHARAGVRIVTGARVLAVRARPPAGGEPATAASAPYEVVCAAADGAVAYPAALVIAGVGIVPNVELARDAGLACDDGILVDERTATSDPRIVAFGDCVRAPSAFLGRPARLETVHNAVEQAKAAAAALAGRDAPYRQVPWVWTDQYAYRIQLVGDASEPDVVLRGDLAAGRVTAFHYAGETLRGVCAINRPADFGAARRLLQHGVALPRAAAADLSFDLRQLVPPRARAGYERPWPRELERVARRTA